MAWFRQHSAQLNTSVQIRGWVRTHRDSKNLTLLRLNDGSNQSGIQIIAEPTRRAEARSPAPPRELRWR